MFHHLLEATDGVFCSAQEGIDASDVVENRGFFRIKFERPAGPFKTPFVVSHSHENSCS